MNLLSYRHKGFCGGEDGRGQGFREQAFRERMEQGRGQQERGEQGRHGGFGGHGRHGGFGPEGGRGRGMRGGGGGPLRMFEAGDLRYVILSMIAEKPSHGYDLIKQIEERMGGAYAPSPGVIYPMLTMLEEMGHATVALEGTRKLYSITEEGAKSLAEKKDLVDAVMARIGRARAEQTAARAPGIERAVENFRMALRMRSGSLTTEQVHAITDIIDAAAKAIERA